MKQIISAIFLSILLHLLILYTYKLPKTSKSLEKSEIKGKDKVLVHYVKLRKTNSLDKISPKIIKKEEKQTEKKVKIKAKETLEKKKYIKVKKIVKTARRKVIKRDKNNIEKTNKNKTLKKEEILPSFLVQKTSQFKKEIIKDILKEPLDLRMLDQLTQSYIKLYGEDYNNFTKIQKVYLQNNLKNIGRITQKYLRYPKLSIKMRQSGMNIVEFTLYPNGDISEPKIINSSDYAALDKNTLETIYIAYKDYPRPREATKIRIYVTYRLY